MPRKAQVLTAKQAAVECGCNVVWLYLELNRGKLPATRNFRGEWQISRKDFDRWLIGYGYRRRERAAKGEGR